MQNKQSKSLLERFLSIFTDVKAGEGVTSVVLFANLFLLLTAYYLVKTVREALILSGEGAEVKSYAAAGQALLLLIAVPLYSKLASRLPRKRLINIVTIFFTGCLVLFFLLSQTALPLGVVFYLWVGVFNLMVIAQFWAFANDLYTPEAGKRIFVIVAFGASSGAVFGSFVAGLLIAPIGVNQLMLVAGGLLLVSLVLTNYVDSRQKREFSSNRQVIKQAVDEPIGKKGAFQLVFRNRYLLLIALLMLFLNWVNTTGEYILGKIVSDTAVEAVAAGTAGGLTVGEFIGKFYADFFTIVNIAGFIIQLFIVSRILKYLGVRIALLILPIIALSGYAILAIYPVLKIVRWIKTAENSTDYSLQNTVRQVLFLPTTREEKYKAKQAIDSFFVRSGDVLSAVLVFVGTSFFSFHIKEFALVNLVLAVIWLILAVLIGKEYVNPTRTNENGNG